MSTWEFPGRYDFSIPEAQWLSDLYGIQADLENVIRICNRCEKMQISLSVPLEERTLDWWEECQLLGDLTVTAIVWYGRAFASGVRKGIPSDWVSNLSEVYRDNHNYFKSLRDKYIAHSVNQIEDNQVFVILSPQVGENQVPGNISVEKGRLITLSSERVKDLKDLSQILQMLLTEEIELESSRLLKIVCAMPIENIKARNTESTKIPGEKEVFKQKRKL
jgi:hypothetical protein